MKNSDFINKLSPNQIVEYLKVCHWTEINSMHNGMVRQFLNPTQDNAVLIPMTDSFCDYEDSIYRVLLTIADEESGSIRSVINKLLNPSCDIMRWHISDDSTLLGSIPLNAMSANIDSIKDMLAASCLDTLSPSTFHSKVYTKDVVDQLSKYSFGQTEIGSYILNILCPLGYYQYQLFDADESGLPLSRKINIKVMDNINRIQNSIVDCSSELSDRVASGQISVNFLTSLSDLYEQNIDSEITISTDWNPNVPHFGDNPVSLVKLQPRCVDKVVQTIEHYSPKEEQNVEITYVGKIVNIGAEAELGDRETVNIKVATIDDGLRAKMINVSLKYSDYFKLVSEAFQTSANVKVTGKRSSTAKSVMLSDAMIKIID